MEMMGGLMGAGMGGGTSSSKKADMTIIDGNDTAQLPFGVGHTTIE